MQSYRAPSRRYPVQEVKLVAKTMEPHHLAEELKRLGQNAVVFAKASWCGHCQRYEPEFRAFAPELPFGSVIVEVGDDRPESTVFKKKYNITGFPTLLFFRRDGQWRKHSGDRSKEALIQAGQEFYDLQ